jgi:hypothetical protein
MYADLPPPKRRSVRQNRGEKPSEWDEFMGFFNIYVQFFSDVGKFIRMILNEGLKRELDERKERTVLTNLQYEIYSSAPGDPRARAFILQQNFRGGIN